MRFNAGVSNAFLEVSADFFLGRQLGGFQRGQAILALQALFSGAWQFGQRGFHPLDPFLTDHQRGQVGLGEVAVIVRLLFGALRVGALFSLAPTQRFLVHFSAALEQCLLSLQFVGDAAFHAFKRVQVLDLHPCAQNLAASWADRDVGLKADHALFHVARVHADLAQNPAQGRGIGSHLFQ